MVAPLIVGGILLIILIYVSYSGVKPAFKLKTSNIYTKIRLVDKISSGCAYFMAGEISPGVWKRILGRIKANDNIDCIKVMAGPWILLEDEKFYSYVKFNPKKGKSTVAAEDFWKLHPLFERLKRDIDFRKNHPKAPEKFGVYIRKVAFKNERHFYYDDKNTYIEYIHKRGPFQGATFYEGDMDVRQKKVDDWNNIMDEGWCLKITEDNIEKILEIETLEFCPLSERPTKIEPIGRLT